MSETCKPRKFVEIADLLRDDAVLIVSYANFGHRDRKIYWPYSIGSTWSPTKAVKMVNMHINVHIPFISRMLAVEYFFICSQRYAPETEDR
jgi:hypothetical protein